MQTTTLTLVIIAMAAGAFYFGRERSLAVATGPRKLLSLHSLPGYYGYYVAIWALLPALAMLLMWTLIEPRVIVSLIVQSLPDAQRLMSAGELNLLVNNIQNLATGDVVSGDVDTILREASVRYLEFAKTSRQLMATLAIGLATLGGVFAWRKKANTVLSSASPPIAKTTCTAVLRTTGS